MTGWRLGYAVGNAAVLRALVAIKSNLDSGCFEAIQLAGVRALAIIDEHLPALLATYRERRQAALAGLRELAVDVFPPAGTFYVWAKVPGGMRSLEFAARVLKSTGVVVTPGVGFGGGGEGYFRVALCSDTERVKRAMTLLAEASLWAPSAS
jgi:LL-diaminopimelate aminotransferase